MTLDQIPIFAMLKSKMGYETQRQRVIAANIANADTPDFAPSDLKAFSYSGGPGGFGGRLQMAMSGGGGVAPIRTNAMHIAGKPPRPTDAIKPQLAPDSEARLDGNQVVLEEEMMKMSDARGSYDAAITLYQNSLTLLRTAAKRPGGS